MPPDLLHERLPAVSKEPVMAYLVELSADETLNTLPARRLDAFVMQLISFALS
jgi:hypothetical protein